MTIRGLIDAVENGEFHREEGPARYSKMWEFLTDNELDAHIGPVLVAMSKGREETVAILRALEATQEPTP